MLPVYSVASTTTTHRSMATHGAGADDIVCENIPPNLTGSSSTTTATTNLISINISNATAAGNVSAVATGENHLAGGHKDHQAPYACLG